MDRLYVYVWIRYKRKRVCVCIGADYMCIGWSPNVLVSSTPMHMFLTSVYVWLVCVWCGPHGYSKTF